MSEKCPKCGEKHRGSPGGWRCINRQLAQRDEEIERVTRERDEARGRLVEIKNGALDRTGDDGMGATFNYTDATWLFNLLHGVGSTCPDCVEKDERIRMARDAWSNRFPASQGDLPVVGVIRDDARKICAALDGGREEIT